MKSLKFHSIRNGLFLFCSILFIFTEYGWAVDQPILPNIQSYKEPSAYAGEDRVAIAGEQVQFFGYGSSLDDEIILYTWDFESDGIDDFVSTQTGCTTHQFNLPGDYQCRLTVKDSFDRITHASRHIIVVRDKTDAAAAKQMLSPIKVRSNNPADGVVRHYAIIINGSNESRFWIDVKLIYEMYINKYGFSPSDIYLLNYDGKDYLGNNPDGMIDYPATYANLVTVFNTLGSQTDADDELSIWITDHGRGYTGPLSEGGQYLGYCDGRTSVDPGDEPDFVESDFKLRSLFTGGDYRCNHGLGVWVVRKKYVSSVKTEYYRNKFVSTLDNIYIESTGTTVSDSDVKIERLKDYALGDTNRDGYIDTSAGEVFDYDHDGRQPYNPATGEFDEDDWGAIDVLEDNYNQPPCILPENSSPFLLFDANLEGKICIDLKYSGGVPTVDGRDEDNAGLFDWMDVNQDGDVGDIVSIDELAGLYTGDLYDDDLADLLDTLTVAKVTVVAETCFSGGFTEDISAPGRIICTATTEDAVSWGNLFIRGFASALYGLNENGASVNADTNLNGHVSMLEAFNYAAGHDYFDEIPQYDDNGDSVSNTDPIPAGGDGTLGCQTYLGGFLAGDFDGDSAVDSRDYAMLSAFWLKTNCSTCAVDLTCDAVVDMADLYQFVNYWLLGTNGV